ncbi:MAG: hypothetical protein FJ280_17720 [Planctomycetes bacterium]|nr:hypothetical protein [Planctomycetota bacterium]
MRTWRNTHILGLALLLTALAPAVGPAQDDRPGYTLTITPANPTAQDVLTLTISGTWSDDCPPNKLKVEVQGIGIFIDMLLPGFEEGIVPTCKPVKTAWQVTTTIGPLPADAYRVYARGVMHGYAGGYAKIGELLVRAAGDVGPDPSTGAPEKPAEPVPDPGAASPKTPAKPEPQPDPGSADVPAGPSEPKPSLPRELIPPEGLELGVSMVLMDATACPDAGLETGRCGIILCDMDGDPAGRIQVTWYFYGQGWSDKCTDAEGLTVAFPSKSARWMDTKKVPLAIWFDRCGTLEKGQDDCVLLKTEAGHVYNLIGGHLLNEGVGPTDQFHFGDRVRVRGLLQACGPRLEAACLCPKQKGDVHWPILTLHIPPEETRSEAREACPGDILGIDMAHRQVWLARDPQCPGGKHTLRGSATTALSSSSGAALAIAVTPLAGIGGKWKASLSPERLNANQWTSINITIGVEDIDLSEFALGEDVLVADFTFGPR